MGSTRYVVAGIHQVEVGRPGGDPAKTGSQKMASSDLKNVARTWMSSIFRGLGSSSWRLRFQVGRGQFIALRSPGRKLLQAGSACEPTPRRTRFARFHVE